MLQFSIIIPSERCKGEREVIPGELLGLVCDVSEPGSLWESSICPFPLCLANHFEDFLSFFSSISFSFFSYSQFCGVNLGKPKYL